MWPPNKQLHRERIRGHPVSHSTRIPHVALFLVRCVFGKEFSSVVSIKLALLLLLASPLRPSAEYTGINVDEATVENYSNHGRTNTTDWPCSSIITFDGPPWSNGNIIQIDIDGICGLCELRTPYFITVICFCRFFFSLGFSPILIPYLLFIYLLKVGWVIWRNGSNQITNNIDVDDIFTWFVYPSWRYRFVV